ncbi:MAG: type II toxin-antitoxin system RelB/DinJ family antitoxin [Oscillospiraceae bacterium]|jgi:addiction module RelB/DinJ family antitoxin|nr:type II toxin-antitoxin system RelB/DinJ family antitoxin [Oscillospiraceae bacterium]
MSKLIQLRVDDDTKTNADNLFASLGLDTPTALRIFLAASLEERGIPFMVAQKPTALPDLDWDAIAQSGEDIQQGRTISLDEFKRSMQVAYAQACEGGQ